MKTVLIFVFFLIGSVVLASGDHSAPEVEMSSRVGQGKAIEAFDKEEGFKLSQKAMKTLGITFSKISGENSWQVPKSALVRIKQSDAVYRRYDGWISLVLVNITGKAADAAIIKSPDLESGDEIATSGAQFLRMTDADLNAGTVDSCSH